MYSCKTIKTALFMVLAILLTACSSGGGGSAAQPPTATSPAMAATATLTFEQTKNFRFSWVDVSDASHYKLLENPDGLSGFSQVGTDIPQGTQGTDHIVPLPKRLNAQYILQSCNATSCTDSAPLSVSNTLVAAIGYFKASNTEMSDQFGVALALSSNGNTLAVGSREDSNATSINGNQDDNTANSSGAVYIFTRVDSSWNQQAYIKASNAEMDDRFGTALALSSDGNTLAVGATSEASNATSINGNQNDNTANISGAVYVFTRVGSSWNQQAYIKASNAGMDDRFGIALALSNNGNTLAVGAIFEDSSTNGDQNDNSTANSGAVYLFTRTGIAWSQQAYLKASNANVFDRFGTALALSNDGDTLAIGANGEGSNTTGINGDPNDNSAGFSGAVYLFTRANSSWSQQAYLKASNTGGGDQFGAALAMSSDGNTLAVGAPREDSDALDSGAIYVFTRIGATWNQQAYLKASNIGTNDQFGTALAMSHDGDTLAVGAVLENSSATGLNGDQSNNAVDNSGAVYLFTRTGTAWNQQTYLKASNTGDGDQFGTALALNDDGNTLAVGAIFESSATTGINGNQNDNMATDSGAVYLY
ncbi:MAG: FG-GAP repeat protein [Gammaproteobacteria bacterium]|nr:FG-GAP repeat protein [Gammaproteobacteria bacterium]